MSKTKQHLDISPTLHLPLESITNTFAILSRRRVGKTYTASVTAEEMIHAGLPFVALDPTGAWWGLSSSADGKSEGLPVIIIGGPHAHIPLEASAGRIIADLVVDHPGWYIIDFSRFSNRAEEIRFATDFGNRLYRRKQHSPGALHLFIDEADQFVPQKMPKAGVDMFNAYDGIIRRGGVYGLGVTLISQRPALINKDVLTQCAVLIALRTSAPEDQDPILNKVSRNGTAVQVAEIRKTLASLGVGEAWYFAPDEDIFTKIKIRQRETFNSSATPKPGVAPIEPKIFSQIDIADLGEKITQTVEKARRDDPEYLRHKINELELKLSERPREVVREELPAHEIKIPILPDVEYQELHASLNGLESRVRDLQQKNAQFYESAKECMDALLNGIAKPAGILQEVKVACDNAIRQIVSTPAPSMVYKQRESHHATTTPTPPYKHSSLTSPKQRILDAISWLESMGLYNPKRVVIAFLANQSPRSSGYTNNLGSLRADGLVSYPSSDTITLTEQGRTMANQPTKPLNSNDLQAAILSRLPRPQARILEILISNGGQPIERAQLALSAGQSPTSSGYTNNLGALRSLGVIDYPDAKSACALGVLWI